MVYIKLYNSMKKGLGIWSKVRHNHYTVGHYNSKDTFQELKDVITSETKGTNDCIV